MAKQPTPSRVTQRPPEKKQIAGQLRDRQGSAKNLADREHDESAKEGGGEESKHGRKQKGNVDDT